MDYSSLSMAVISVDIRWLSSVEYVWVRLVLLNVHHHRFVSGFVRQCVSGCIRRCVQRYVGGCVRLYMSERGYVTC